MVAHHILFLFVKIKIPFFKFYKYLNLRIAADQNIILIRTVNGADISNVLLSSIFNGCKKISLFEIFIFYYFLIFIISLLYMVSFSK